MNAIKLRLDEDKAEDPNILSLMEINKLYI